MKTDFLDLGKYNRMTITTAQLAVGFAAAMTGPALAAYLGVSTRELWVRLKNLTPAEEEHFATIIGSPDAHPA
jgi:hypothetical protein